MDARAQPTPEESTMKSLFLSLSLLFTLLSTGCGPAGQEFHGTYSLSGITTLTLTGYGSETAQLSGSRRISEGATSDIVLSDLSGQCLLPADVEGVVASFKPGTSCTQNVDGVTVTLSVSNGTATLVGKVVQFHLTGNLTATMEGRTFPGTFSQTGTLTRIGK
jgi:hypothetical protein